MKPKPAIRSRRKPRLIELHGETPNEDTARFFLEERARRSFGVTGYLLSGAGAGAVTCWFEVVSLYGYRAPAPVLHGLLIASSLFLAAVVIGFVAALAGYKAFDIAASQPPEDFTQPYNRADRWIAAATTARVAATALIAAGGLTALAAFFDLGWR